MSVSSTDVRFEAARDTGIGDGRDRVGLAPVIIRGQSSPIMVAGKPVEISVATISRSTVRISVRPIVNGKPQAIVNRGALVDAAEQQRGERRSASCA